MHYSACQGAHPTKALLAEIYGLPAAQVRVIVPDVGGGFGAKARTYPEESRPRLLRPPDRTARAVDRDPHREHPRHAQLGAARRSTPGSAGAVTAGSRPTNSMSSRTPAPIRSSAPHAGDDTAHGDGRVRHWQRRIHRCLGRYQCRVDDGVPRRRPARGCRWRSSGWSIASPPRSGWTRPTSPEELRRSLHGAVHDGDRHGVRRRRLPGVPGAGAFGRRATSSCAPNRRADGTPPIRSRSGSAWRRTSR